MLGVGHTPNLRVVRRAPHAGTAAVHNGYRDAKPVADLVHGTRDGFLRLHRESAAAAAGAAKFGTLEIPDILPPVCAACLGDILGVPGHLPGGDHLPDTRFRPDAEYPVRRKPVIPLESPRGRLGHLSPGTVNLPCIVPKIPQQMLLLLRRQRPHLTLLRHTARTGSRDKSAYRFRRWR